MPPFQPSDRPDATPWGAIDSAEQIHPGIWHVTTPSHGGFLLSDARQRSMPECLMLDHPIYEEDTGYALVVLAFAPEFAASAAGPILLRNAHDTVRNWHPDRYARFTGAPVEPRDSYVLKMREAYRERIGRAVVVAAFGDWADWVPKGKTGVIARMLTSLDHLARPTYESADRRALVDAERYAARGSVIALDELDAVSF